MSEQHKNDQAERAFGDAIITDPTDTPAYYRRAYQRLVLGDFDGALKDADEYAAYSLSTELAMHQKGAILYAKGEAKAAVEHYTAALTIRQNDAALLHERGIARIYAGDLLGAIGDFSQALQQEPTDLYGALWLDLATERNGGPSTLAPPQASDPSAPWPAPIARFFLGQIDRDALTAATKADPAQTSNRLCEADFFATDRDLIQHKVGAEATARVAAECPPAFFERSAAAYEQKLAAAK